MPKSHVYCGDGGPYVMSVLWERSKPHVFLWWRSSSHIFAVMKVQISLLWYNGSSNVCVIMKVHIVFLSDAGPYLVFVPQWRSTSHDYSVVEVKSHVYSTWGFTIGMPPYIRCAHKRTPICWVTPSEYFLYGCCPRILQTLSVPITIP